MSVMNKPDYKIFAQDAKSGEYVAFPDILRGWGITLDQYNGFPPMELFNSAAKRIDEWLMYLTQRGLPEWDAAVDYPKDAMIQHAGVYYVSLKVTKGEQPNNSQASWKKLTEALGIDGKLAKDQNGADITNKPKFIENLGLPEKFQKKGDYQPVGDYADKTSKELQEFKGGVRAPYIDAITGEDRTGFRMINKKAIIYSVVDGKVYQVAIPLRTGDAVLTDDLPKLPLIGSGSTRSGLTSSRELGVTYTNNRPYSIFVTVMLQSTARDSNLITRMRISDTPASNFYIGTRGNDTDILAEATHSQLVLPGERYVVTSSPNSKIVSWVEIAQ